MSDWQASDGRTTYTFTGDEFMEAVRKLKESYQKAQAQRKRWSSLDALMADLDKQKAQVHKPVDPVTRRTEIETELDIIRGRIPTPKGYTVDPVRAKQLMIELKQLPT